MGDTSVCLYFSGEEVKRVINGVEISYEETRMPLKSNESTIGVYSDGEYYTVTVRRHRKDDNEWRES